MSKESKEERDALMRRSALEERARVVAWLRRIVDAEAATPTFPALDAWDPDPAIVGVVRVTIRTFLAALIQGLERGKHGDASAGGAQEPRSGGEGEA